MTWTVACIWGSRTIIAHFSHTQFCCLSMFSSLHVSGEQLSLLSGVAAILRYPLPELDDDAAEPHVAAAGAGAAGAAVAAAGAGPGQGQGAQGQILTK